MELAHVLTLRDGKAPAWLSKWTARKPRSHGAGGKRLRRRLGLGRGFSVPRERHRTQRTRACRSFSRCLPKIRIEQVTAEYERECRHLDYECSRVPGSIDRFRPGKFRAGAARPWSFSGRQINDGEC